MTVPPHRDQPGTPSAEPSLRQLLADLHAHRVATWDPADLQQNIDQRRLLEETADRESFVKPGDVMAAV